MQDKQDKKIILIELSKDTYRQVSDIAQEEERSVRYIIRKLVEIGLEHVSE